MFAAILKPFNVLCVPRFLTSNRGTRPRSKATKMSVQRGQDIKGILFGPCYFSNSIKFDVDISSTLFNGKIQYYFPPGNLTAFSAQRTFRD